MTDYRNAVAYPSKEAAEAARNSGAPTKERWWMVKGDERDGSKTLANAVKSTFDALYRAAAPRRMANVRHARLYENCELDALAGTDYAASIVRQTLLGGGLVALNVAAACVDTLAAKVAKNRPRPEFLTSGQGWASQQKARRLDKFMRGHFYDTQIYQKAPHVFIDAGEFGTGFLQVFRKDGEDRLDCERVMPDQMYIDDIDGQYGTPRQMLRLRQVQRPMLLACYPEYAVAINSATHSNNRPLTSTPQNIEDTIDVVEAWHLPSGPKAKDGRHVIAIDGAVLLDEPWKIDRFPFVELRYKRRTMGFYGKGVIESVAGIQIELNRLVRSISEQLRRKGRGRIFVPIGSKLNPASITNGIGELVYHTPGMPPVVDNQNAVAQEEFMQIDRLYQRAFQEVGISELSAAAKKPSGLDAAVALREYSDIESERFALVHQAWEQFFLDYASLSIDLITKQYKFKSYPQKVPSRRFVETVDWKDIDLERDAFIMQMYPVSSLPQTPAARLQRVQELQAGGYITQAQALRLLEFPDVEAEMNLQNALLDDVEATISRILDDEEPQLMPLEPYQNIDLMIQRANAHYLYARHHDCPEDRLEMLRMLIDSATALKAQAMAPPPMPAAPPMPGAPPMPPPPGGPINNTINVPPPPPAPAVPPVVGG